MTAISMVKTVFSLSLPTLLKFLLSFVPAKDPLPLQDSPKSNLSVSSSTGSSLLHICLGVNWGTPTHRTNSRKSAAGRKLKYY